MRATQGLIIHFIQYKLQSQCFVFDTCDMLFSFPAMYICGLLPRELDMCTVLRARRCFYSLFLFSRVQEGVGEGHQGAPFDEVVSCGFSTEQQYSIRAQSFTSLMADLRHDINSFFI